MGCGQHVISGLPDTGDTDELLPVTGDTANAGELLLMLLFDLCPTFTGVSIKSGH